MTRLHLMQCSLLPGFLLGLMSCADASLSARQQADPEFRIYADLSARQQADPEFRIEVLNGRPQGSPRRVDPRRSRP